MLKSVAFDIFSELLEHLRMRELISDNIQPAEPLGLVFARPERRIPPQKPAHFPARFKLRDGCLHLSVYIRGQSGGLRIEGIRNQAAGFEGTHLRNAAYMALFMSEAGTDVGVHDVLRQGRP